MGDVQLLDLQVHPPLICHCRVFKRGSLENGHWQNGRLSRDLGLGGGHVVDVEVLRVIVLV